MKRQFKQLRLFSGFLWLMGVTPDGSKTGKREAAWALIAIALGLQISAMAMGAAMVAAMQPVMSILWPSAVLAIAGAYKLEYDKQQLQVRAAAAPASVLAPTAGDGEIG